MEICIKHQWCTFAISKCKWDETKDKCSEPLNLNGGCYLYSMPETDYNKLAAEKEAESPSRNKHTKKNLFITHIRKDSATHANKMFKGVDFVKNGSIDGFRGFIVNVVGTDEQLKNYNRSFWPQLDDGTLSPYKMWSSNHSIYGREYLFDPDRNDHDFDAGSQKTRSQEAIIRGVSSIHYDPSREVVFRRQYMVTVDVWNNNHYW